MSNTHFYPLTVREVRRETVDTVSVAFNLPAEWAENFAFTQGQYLTLRSTLNGEDIRRSYSICSAPYENELRVAIKKVDGGVFSTWANTSLKAGDTIEVMPPQGRFFTPLDPARKGWYVAFASGSGITPIISILKTVLVQEPHSRFTLFYGNRGFDHIVFREELDALKNLYPDRLAVHHVFSRESLGSDLFHGRLDSKKCHSFSRYFFEPAALDAVFLCGPEDMIFSIKDALVELGTDIKRIHFELFTTSGSKKKTILPQTETPSFEAEITVIQDGVQFDFLLPSMGSTLLDAAMRAGADLPFSCKGGVCSTCKAKVLEGAVHMEINYGLEPDEVAAGYVLTCQSHPTSRKVVVSFDV